MRLLVQPIPSRDHRGSSRFPPRTRLGCMRDLPRGASKEPVAQACTSARAGPRHAVLTDSRNHPCCPATLRQVPHSPFYVSMVTAWCLAEIIRYTHYVTGLQGFKIKPLEWIRYVWVCFFRARILQPEKVLNLPLFWAQLHGVLHPLPARCWFGSDLDVLGGAGRQGRLWLLCPARDQLARVGLAGR